MTRKIPNDPIRLWSDFLTGAFTNSSNLDAIQCRFRFTEESIRADTYLADEEIVVNLFLDVMRAINNQRLILLPSPERWGGVEFIISKSKVFQMLYVAVPVVSNY